MIDMNMSRDLQVEMVNEIEKHRGLQSQKAGYDIGFDQAAEDWFIHFSVAWIQYRFKDNEQQFMPVPKARFRFDNEE